MRNNQNKINIFGFFLFRFLPGFNFGPFFARYQNHIFYSITILKMEVKLPTTTSSDDLEIITHANFDDTPVPVETPQIIEIDELDEDHLSELSTWFIKNVDVLPSLAKSYCGKLFEIGIGSLKRLGKKLTKEPTFLNDLGFKHDDVHEIVEALKK